MSKLAIMEYDEYADLCDAIRHKAGTTEPLTAKSAKETVANIEILNTRLIDGSIKEFVIPQEVTKLRPYAFAYSDLEKITFHEGVTHIGANCFENCFSAINNLTLPSNLEYVGSRAFYTNNAYNLSTYQSIYNSTNEHWLRGVYTCPTASNPHAVIQSYSYNDNISQYGINLLEHFPNVEFIDCNIYAGGSEHQEEELIIPATVKGITSALIDTWSSGINENLHTLRFADNSQLLYIQGNIIPSDINTKFPNLKNLYIPAGQLLNSSEFSQDSIVGGGNTGIENLYLGANVSLIGPWKIYNSISLKNIYIEDGTTPLTIGDYGLRYNQALTQLIFPSRLVSLGHSACIDNPALTTVYFNSIIPGSYITEYGHISSYEWFWNCPNLTDIYVPWSEGEVEGAPWGANNATIHYNYTPTQEE